MSIAKQGRYDRGSAVTLHGSRHQRFVVPRTGKCQQQARRRHHEPTGRAVQRSIRLLPPPVLLPLRSGDAAFGPAAPRGRPAASTAAAPRADTTLPPTSAPPAPPGTAAAGGDAALGPAAHRVRPIARAPAAPRAGMTHSSTSAPPALRVTATTGGDVVYGPAALRERPAASVPTAPRANSALPPPTLSHPQTPATTSTCGGDCAVCLRDN